MPIATKLGRVVTDKKEVPPINSHDPSNTLLCEVR